MIKLSQVQLILIIQMGAVSSCCQKQQTLHNPERVALKKTIQVVRVNSKSDKPLQQQQNEKLQTEEKLNNNESPQSERRGLPSSKKNRGPEDYQHLKYLGKGAFGCVVLVQQKATSKRYAMKIIEKSKIKEFNLLQSDRIQQVKHERFLVNIKETFQTESKIYIVMEYLPMGDLYYYLNKKDKPFSEETIIGIAAQIVVTLSILHSQGIVYRELKPENVLVTDDGHLKLTDYGLSKIIPQDRDLISTFVGTIEYMAPEAYAGNFGQKADIWSLGILLYELMFRENIFEIQANKIMSMLKEGTFPFDKTLISDKINSRIGCMSSQFRALLLRLLQPDPELRISLQQMREHDFFKGLSWQSVQLRENEPPLKQIKTKKDIIKFRDPASEKYFRKEYNQHRSPPDYQIQLYQFCNSQ